MADTLALCTLNTIPSDNLFEIIKYLEVYSILMLQHTSKHLRDASRKHCADSGCLHDTLVSDWIYHPITSGNVGVVRWMVECAGINIPKDAFSSLVDKNYGNMSEYLIFNEATPTDDDLLYHARYGTFNTFQHILQHITADYDNEGVLRDSQFTEVCSEAAASGRLEMIELAYKWDYPLSADVWTSLFKNAPEADDKTVSWLLDNKCDITFASIVSAAEYSTFDVVKKLAGAYGIPKLHDDLIDHENSVDLAGNAIHRDNIDMFEWILSLNPLVATNIHEYICTWAISLETMVYLVSAGYLLSEDVFARTAHIKPIAEYLSSIDCPMDTSAYTHAANNGDLDTMKWIQSIGVRIHDVAAELINISVRDHHFEMFEWLIDFADDLTGVDELAIEYDNLKVLQWFIAEGHFTIDQAAIRSAVQHGSAVVLAFAANYCPIERITVYDDNNGVIDLDVLKLYMKKPSWTPKEVRNVCKGVITSGFFDHIRYVMDNSDVFPAGYLELPFSVSHRYSGKKWSSEALEYFVYTSLTHGDGVLAEWLYTVSGCKVTRFDILLAMSNQHDEASMMLLKRYMREGGSLDADLMVDAVKYCDSTVTGWVFDHDAPLTTIAFAEAVERGDSHLVNWLCHNHCPIPCNMTVKWCEDTIKVKIWTNDCLKTTHFNFH